MYNENKLKVACSKLELTTQLLQILQQFRMKANLASFQYMPFWNILLISGCLKICDTHSVYAKFALTQNQRLFENNTGSILEHMGKKWFAFSKMDKISVENIVKAVSRLI